jgi:hypothetical protein
MVETTGLKKYGIVVTFSGMTSLLNFIKFNEVVQKLLVGYLDRQHGDLVSLSIFEESSRINCKEIRREGVDQMELS